MPRSPSPTCRWTPVGNVTGSHVPTRSVLGTAPAFACGAGQRVRADVRVEVR